MKGRINKIWKDVKHLYPKDFTEKQWLIRRLNESTFEIEWVMGNMREQYKEFLDWVKDIETIEKEVKEWTDRYKELDDEK